MKYFIIAGEPSGDLHGSSLVRALLGADTGAAISCWGGTLMQEAGAELLKHYSDTAFMGVWEVLVNLRRIRDNFRVCRSQIAAMRPDVLILIDYPGFNLRMARYASRQGIKVFYYISPKFWAWGEGRVRRIKKYVDRLYIIFPFEKEFYARHDYPAIFLGNPLVDHVEVLRRESSAPDRLKASLGLDHRPVIALLAGSRVQEVKRLLPLMAGAAGAYPDYQFVVAAMDHLPAVLYREAAAIYPVKIVTGRSHDLLAVSEAALVASGTATLEAALIGVPQVVCYSTSRLTYLMAKWVIRVRFISLVNLIMDREVVKELIQDDLTPATLHRELGAILFTGYRNQMIRCDYAALREVLGGPGASRRVADDMVTTLMRFQGK